MKINRKGKEIEIKVAVEGDDGRAVADLFYNVRISGWSNSLVPPEKQSPDIRAKLAKLGKGDHWTFGSLAGMIALSPAEAQELKEEFEAAEKNWIPGINYWINKREQIVRRINAATEAAQERRNRSRESGDGSGQWVNAGDELDREAEELAEKLNQFDAEHPEVIAEIRQMNKDAAERNQWN